MYFCGDSTESFEKLGLAVPAGSTLDFVQNRAKRPVLKKTASDAYDEYNIDPSQLIPL